MKFTLHTDGGARGNPGPAALGAILKDEDKNIVKEIGKYIGETTNNIAEYKGLIEGLQMCVNRDVRELVCYLDSELITKQLKGEYRVKNVNLKKLWLEVKDLEKKFKSIEYKHVKREHNKEADALVNDVLDAMI